MCDEAISGERDQLVVLIQSYLNEQIKAFDFDERLESFRDSDDEVVAYVSRTLWYFYDDFVDHPVVLEKAGWDHIQRMLLMLKTRSSMTIETLPSAISVPTRAIAISILIAFAVCVVVVGWNFFLLIPSTLCGIAAYSLQLAGRPRRDPMDIYRDAVFPFASLNDLERAYRDADFCKEQYPRSYSGRTIRNQLESLSTNLQCLLGLPLWGPLILLLEVFPGYVERSVVRVA